MPTLRGDLKLAGLDRDGDSLDFGSSRLRWVEGVDDQNSVDLAAIRFHEQRNYWRGFPKKLAELKEAGTIEILKQKRSYFGSLYIEGYSQFIWRPRN